MESKWEQKFEEADALISTVQEHLRRKLDAFREVGLDKMTWIDGLNHDLHLARAAILDGIFYLARKENKNVKEAIK